MGQLNKSTAELNQIIRTQRHYLSGYEATGLTTASGNTNFLTEEIELEANTNYIISGGIQIEPANTSDARIQTNNSDITRSIIKADGTVDYDNISSYDLPQTATVIQAHTFSGAIATGSNPTLRFKIAPTSGSVDVFWFWVEIRKATDVLS